jgi:hypothetical protein
MPVRERENSCTEEAADHRKASGLEITKKVTTEALLQSDQ